MLDGRFIPQTVEGGEMNQTGSCVLTGAQTFPLGAAADNARDSDFALAQTAPGGAEVGELYIRHRRRVYSMCFRMTHNAADAEDLTQEVFIHLLRKVSSFRGESQFTTWLHRVTVNMVLMRIRRDTRRKLLAPEGAEADLPISHNMAPTPVVDQIALNAALSQLPPGYRSVFVLCDIEGHTHDEVARMLGCSPGTSKSQLHKARMRLRWLLKRGSSAGRQQTAAPRL